MFDLILLYILSIQNRRMAEKKGYDGRPWFWKTALAFLIGEILGITIFVISVVAKHEKIELTPEFMASQRFLLLNVFFLICGVGGFLWTRKKIENLKPQKPPTPKERL